MEEINFSEDYKRELIDIIEGILSGKPSLTDRQASILFHWVRNANSAMYSWVPDKYKKALLNYAGSNN